jgi:cell division transport system permease protein
MPVPYGIKVAFQSLMKDIWLNLLSVLTIAVGLSIMSIAFFLVYNLDRVTKKLPERFTMVVYLDEDLPRESVEQAIHTFKKNRTINAVRYISKEKGMEELRSLLRDSQHILEGLDENPLPDTLELKLKKEAVGQETVRKLAAEALTIKGVKEVDYGVQFLSTLHSLKVGIKTIGLTFIIILSIGIIFVCYSTVKILFYRKNEEIETLKLLGATRGFISFPFLVEGAVIGASGGILSLAGLFAFYNIVLLRLIIAIPVIKSVIMPSSVFLSLPAIGFFLGITGAFFALGRLKY